MIVFVLEMSTESCQSHKSDKKAQRRWLQEETDTFVRIMVASKLSNGMKSAQATSVAKQILASSKAKSSVPVSM